VTRQADVKVTITCPGAVESLNAAVAASVTLYEAARQRREQEIKIRGRRGGSR
jgi:TrmH family RNA methyltransferase